MTKAVMPWSKEEGEMETSIASAAPVAERDVLEVSVCMHQWMIDSPNGPSSRGVCLLCGSERDFPNYIEGTAWGYDVSVEQLNADSRIGTRWEPVIEDEDA